MIVSQNSSSTVSASLPASRLRYAMQGRGFLPLQRSPTKPFRDHPLLPFPGSPPVAPLNQRCCFCSCRYRFRCCCCLDGADGDGHSSLDRDLCHLKPSQPRRHHHNPPPRFVQRRSELVETPPATITSSKTAHRPAPPLQLSSRASRPRQPPLSVDCTSCHSPPTASTPALLCAVVLAAVLPSSPRLPTQPPSSRLPATRPP